MNLVEGANRCIHHTTSMKQSLIETPVLTLPNANKLFSVVCNANKFAIGSALMQKDNHGVDRVFSHESQLVLAVELKKPMHDKELRSSKHVIVPFQVLLVSCVFL